MSSSNIREAMDSLSEAERNLLIGLDRLDAKVKTCVNRLLTRVEGISVPVRDPIIRQATMTVPDVVREALRGVAAIVAEEKGRLEQVLLKSLSSPELADYIVRSGYFEQERPPETSLLAVASRKALVDEAQRRCRRTLQDHHDARGLAERIRIHYSNASRPGDAADVYGSGGLVKEVEEETARILGKDAAVLFPTGVMAQQAAMQIWAEDGYGRRVAMHPTAHPVTSEEGSLERAGFVLDLVGDPATTVRFEHLGKNPSMPARIILLEMP